jgi:Flp pilus assembly protein TadD
VLHVLPIPAPKAGEQKILAQVRYRDPAGRTVFGEPKVVSFGPDADLRRLLRELDSPDQAVRREAAITLEFRRVTYRVEDVRAGLRPLLRKHSERRRLMQVLAEFDPRQAAPAVAELLADEDRGVRLAAYQLLGGLRDPRAVDALVAAVPKDWALASAHAIGVLRGMGPAAETALLPHLASKDDKVRSFVITSLQEVGTAASLAALEALPADDPLAAHVRGAVATIRERLPLKDDEWPRALDDLKSRDYARVDRAARRVAVTPPVEARRKEVLDALGALPPFVGTPLSVQQVPLRALARWGGPDAIPLVLRQLDNRYITPAQVVNLMAEMKTEEAAAAVVKLIELNHFQGNAARPALLAIGPPAEKAVLSLLAGPDSRRGPVEACWVLGQIGGRDSVAPLRAAADKPDPLLACAAAQALASVEARLRTAAHYNQGHALRAKRDFPGAVAAFREAARLDPNDARAHNYLGAALLDAKDLPGAVAAFREAIRLNPNYAQAHYNLGIALNNLGESDQAIAAYREAIRLNPSYAQAHNNLGTILQKQGDLDAAIACFREAIRLDPKLPQPRNNLDRVLKRKAERDAKVAPPPRPVDRP